MSTTLRRFMTARLGLDLSPLLAAIADASDGITPTTIDDVASERHFGCGAAELPRERPRTVAVRAGGRGGKSSRLIAPAALHCALTVPLPTIRRREAAYSLLIAPDVKLARQDLEFVAGYIEDSPALSRLVVGAPTKDSIELRRPDGRRVKIEVLAATRGGRAVRGRTLVFAGLDECAFFFDESSGVVNDADIYRAVLQRVVPGGQVWLASTPWIADVGLLETTLAKNWGTHKNSLVVTSGTRALNPTWDPDGTIEADMRESDPDAAVREIDGEPMAGGSGQFFGSDTLRQCVDDSLRLDIEPPEGAPVVFGHDLAFAVDSSTQVGVYLQDGVAVVFLVDEMRPAKGKPLRPKAVIDRFAATLQRHHITEFTADGHYRESAREHLEPFSIDFIDAPTGAPGKAATYLMAKKWMSEQRVRIPRHPRLLAQLHSVVAKPLPGGTIRISSPRHAGGGHGDIVSALVLAINAAAVVAEDGVDHLPAPPPQLVDDPYRGGPFGLDVQYGRDVSRDGVPLEDVLRGHYRPPNDQGFAQADLHEFLNRKG